MKYCPNCKRDFEDDVEVCRWCEVELVDELPDEKTVIAEKLRRELMPTMEELSEEQTDFFAENADTVTIYTSFDPLQVRDIERSLREAGIPVLVRPAEPEEEWTEEVCETTEETVEESVEGTEEVEEVAEEEGEESVEEAEPEKKGFFARLFGKKKKDEPNDPVVGYRRPNPFAKMARMTAVHQSDLLDVVVPTALEAEAVSIMNGVLGIHMETEITEYSEEELAEFDQETIGLPEDEMAEETEAEAETAEE